jgi:flagellar biosynthesis/type III secretory pathway protein FliH
VEAAKTRKALMAAKQKELTTMQQQWIQEYLENERTNGRDAGFMANMQAVKHVTIRMKNEMQRYNMVCQPVVAY